MRFFKKKNRAVKRWHSRAMVIDLSRTRVTFLTSEEHVLSERNGKGVFLSAKLIETSSE
jgi:hypothetical protein